MPFIILLLFSLASLGISATHAYILGGIAPFWDGRERVRDDHRYLSRLTQILELSTIQFPGTMDRELRRKMALKIHSKRIERVKAIAELCAFGPIIQNIFIEKFGKDIGSIISSFLFHGFESRVFAGN